VRAAEYSARITVTASSPKVLRRYPAAASLNSGEHTMAGNGSSGNSTRASACESTKLRTSSRISK
jgi:hypothetical protein